MEQSTVVSLTAVHAKHGSYRRTAKALGVSHAVVWNILHERTRDVSLATENKVRAALGLTALLPTVEIPACPDCGDVHHGRCNGKPVAVRVVRRRYLPQRIADYSAKMLAMAIRERMDCDYASN